MPRISEKRKITEGRGTGSGVFYRPWTKISEFNSRGTASNVIDWKNGRQLQLMSQAEVWWFYRLRWDDEVVEIRDQVPLSLDATLAICDQNGFKHPKDRNTHMTTDFLVTYRDGSLKAYSVKADKSVLDNPRTLEKLFIEREYWRLSGVPYQVVYKSDLDRTTIHNVMDVISCYDKSKVFDDFSMIRYMIAHKVIIVDMSTKIDYPALIRQYLKEGRPNDW